MTNIASSSLVNPKKGSMTFLRSVFRKKTVLVTFVVLLFVAGYFGYQAVKGGSVVTRYMLANVQKGTVVSSVSGTGQVSVLSQVDIKSKASGQILALDVQNAQSIKAGSVIARIDSQSAERSVRDAAISLQNAQIALQKLKKPADNFTISQAKSSLQQAKLDLKKLQDPPTNYDLISAQNALAQAQRDLQKANDNVTTVKNDSVQAVEKAYDDGYTTVSGVYLHIQDFLTDAYSVQWGQNDNPQSRVAAYSQILGANSLLISNLLTDYTAADQIFNTSFDIYKTVFRDAPREKIYKLISDTLEMAKVVARELEDARNLLDAVVGQDYKHYYISIAVDTLRPKIQTDLSTINSEIAALQAGKDAIDNANQSSPLDTKDAQSALDAAKEKVNATQASLDKLKAGATSEDLDLARQKVQQQQDSLNKLLEGADPLDLKVQELSVQSKQNALADAQQTFEDYSVKAPFDGIVAKVNVSKGDTVSSGTAIVTAITKQLLAQISLNEVDVAKIKVGEKATLTFDAIDGLSISGEVAEIDTLGTVSQGVVTYNVKIAFDTQDSRVKPGMSVSAAIITDVKADVLVVPNAALKTQGNVHYVEMFPGANTQVTNQNAATSVATNGATAANTATGSANDNVTISSTTPPGQQQVEIGIANDTYTEITNGLKEGDQIVVRTITAKTAASSATSAQGGFGGLRLPGVGGGGRGG